jgi:hypothetical protein
MFGAVGCKKPSARALSSRYIEIIRYRSGRRVHNRFVALSIIRGILHIKIDSILEYPTGNFCLWGSGHFVSPKSHLAAAKGF